VHGVITLSLEYTPYGKKKKILTENSFGILMRISTRLIWGRFDWGRFDLGPMDCTGRVIDPSHAWNWLIVLA
jgi:hypothetical protein